MSGIFPGLEGLASKSQEARNEARREAERLLGKGSSE